MRDERKEMREMFKRETARLDKETARLDEEDKRQQKENLKLKEQNDKLQQQDQKLKEEIVKLRQDNQNDKVKLDFYKDFSRGHATLKLRMSVGRSVHSSVGNFFSNNERFYA